MISSPITHTKPSWISQFLTIKIFNIKTFVQHQFPPEKATFITVEGEGQHFFPFGEVLLTNTCQQLEKKTESNITLQSPFYLPPLYLGYMSMASERKSPNQKSF